MVIALQIFLEKWVCFIYKVIFRFKVSLAYVITFPYSQKTRRKGFYICF